MVRSGGRFHDVIVIGAGPAGATLAYELAKRGIDVAIIEKERLPRHKTCAGGVTARASRLLDFDISPVVERAVYGMRFSYQLRDTWTRKCDQPLIYMVMRNNFDLLLAQKAREAGASLVEGQQAEEMRPSAAGIEVVTPDHRFKCQVLVGADGASSSVARNFGLVTSTLNIGVEAEVPVSDEEMAKWDSIVGLDFGYGGSQYVWLFPKSAHLSIGAMGPSHAAKGLIARCQRFMEQEGLTDCNARFKAGLLPVRKRGAAIHHHRLILIGDAAGLTHPFTGEGIYYAIKSAQIAAPMIASSLESGDFDFGRYQRAVDRELMRRTKRMRVAFKLSGQPVRPFLGLMRRSDRLWRFHCSLLRGGR